MKELAENSGADIEPAAFLEGIDPTTVSSKAS
jgi:hypothetical protein